MENDLQFYCLNVRGAGNKTKRQSIFSWLKSKGNAIIFLQECHSNLTSEEIWCNEWGNKIFFSHGQTNSKGVAILFSHKITFDIVNVKQDTDGRFLLIECNIFGENYTLVNIYAPTGDKSKEQLAFGKYLLEILESYLGNNLILAGDLNTDLDVFLGKSNVLMH